MADTSISLEELIGYLGKFQETTTQQCLKMLQEEIPVGLTGKMLENTKILSMTKEHSVIGVDEREVPYAQIVLNGRDEIYTPYVRSWWDYDGEQTSIHHGTPNVLVHSRYSGPADGNDFIGRTIEKILSADLDVGGFKGWVKRVTRPIRRAVRNVFRRGRRR